MKKSVDSSARKVEERKGRTSFRPNNSESKEVCWLSDLEFLDELCENGEGALTEHEGDDGCEEGRWRGKVRVASAKGTVKSR